MSKYYYSKATGELATGLIPKGDDFDFTTKTPPKNLEDNQSAIFDGSDWKVVTSTPEAEPIPDFVTMRQAQLQLVEMGIFEQVEGLLEGNLKAQIEWRTATIVERTNPIVVQIASELGLSEAEVDGMMLAASKIK